MVQTGKDAYFKIKAGSDTSASAMGYVNSWSLTINGASIDITSLGELWRSYQGDVKDWSVSATASLDLSDSADKALFDMLCSSTSVVVAVELHMGVGNNEFVGDAILTSAPVTATVGDKVSVNFSFQGTGALELKEVSQ